MRRAGGGEMASCPSSERETRWHYEHGAQRWPPPTDAGGGGLVPETGGVSPSSCVDSQAVLPNSTVSGTVAPSLCSSHADRLKVPAVMLTGEFTSTLEPSITAEPPLRLIAEPVSVPPDILSRDDAVLPISCVLVRTQSVTANVLENMTVPEQISTRSSVTSPSDCTDAAPPLPPSIRRSASTNDAIAATVKPAPINNNG